MSDATELALRALRHRDRSRQDLEERLERAGVPADQRAEALDELAAQGLVSDDRFAQERARGLAARNGGDAFIRGDLRRHGIPDDVATAALDELEPEGDRAARIFRERGGGERALRYLAGKGFSRESLECLTHGDPVD
jgi:SOS response regulatory protein OraA/RecX